MLSFQPSSTDDRRQVVAKAESLYFSSLNPDVYGTFDRDLFIETLNDWGWFGAESNQPAWYTGWNTGEPSSP